MSTDQVRWKINALIKKYKECVDNNSKSGRSFMTFKWFDQMDEIFNQGKNAITNHTFSSKCMKTAKPSTSSTTEIYSKSLTSTLIPCNSSDTLQSSCTENSENISTSVDSTLSMKNKNKHLSHGTNSNIARDKIELENQWLEYIKRKIERDKICDERHASVSEHRKELLKLKRKCLAIKEEEMKQRKEYLMAKLRGKENRHAEIVAIEEKKCKLLKKIVKARSSDSD